MSSCVMSELGYFDELRLFVQEQTVQTVQHVRLDVQHTAVFYKLQSNRKFVICLGSKCHQERVDRRCCCDSF